MKHDKQAKIWLERKFHQAEVAQIDTMMSIQPPESSTTRIVRLETDKKYSPKTPRNEFETIQAQCQKAFHVIYDYLIYGQRYFLKLSSNEKTKLLNEIKQGQENILSIIQTNKLNATLNSSNSLQDILNYSPQTIDKFYLVGLACLENKAYQNARDVFKVLVLIHPHYHNFWLGLAMCQQALGQWEEAIQAYSFAEVTDAKDPIPYLHESECHALLHDNIQAVIAVDKALHCVEDDENNEFVDFKRLANEWKQTLLKSA